MDYRVEKVGRRLQPLVTREVKWWTWKRVLAAAVLSLALLEGGTYAFNWSWTGFNANHKLWDWLSILLMPMIVAVLPIWFSIHHSHGGDQTGQQHQQQASPPVGPHSS